MPGDRIARLPQRRIEDEQLHEEAAVGGLLFGAAHAVRCAVEFFGSRHVLFGTDMPLGGPAVVADTIADIEALGLPEADVADIFAGNARRLLRIAA